MIAVDAFGFTGPGAVIAVASSGEQLSLVNLGSVIPTGVLLNENLVMLVARGAGLGPGMLLQFDTGTQNLEILYSSSGFSPFGIVLDGNGHYITVDKITATVVRIDPVSGTSIVVASLPPNANVNDLAIEESGTLLVVDSEHNRIFRVHPETGSFSILTENDLLVGPSGIAVSPDGRIYVTVPNEDGRLISLDPDTGEQVLIAEGGFLAGGYPFGIFVVAPAPLPACGLIGIEPLFLLFGITLFRNYRRAL